MLAAPMIRSRPIRDVIGAGAVIPTSTPGIEFPSQSVQAGEIGFRLAGAGAEELRLDHSVNDSPDIFASEQAKLAQHAFGDRRPRCERSAQGARVDLARSALLAIFLGESLQRRDDM